MQLGKLCGKWYGLDFEEITINVSHLEETKIVCVLLISSYWKLNEEVERWWIVCAKKPISDDAIGIDFYWISIPNSMHSNKSLLNYGIWSCQARPEKQNQNQPAKWISILMGSFIFQILSPIIFVLVNHVLSVELYCRLLRPMKFIKMIVKLMQNLIHLNLHPILHKWLVGSYIDIRLGGSFHTHQPNISSNRFILLTCPNENISMLHTASSSSNEHLLQLTIGSLQSLFNGG